jgi:hypothetical protein
MQNRTVLQLTTMIRNVDPNGQVYYTWGKDEQRERELFERSVAPDGDIVESLVHALLEAITKRAVERAQTWEQVKQCIDPQDLPCEMEYQGISKRLVVIPTKE